MTDISRNTERNARWMRNAARGIASVWAICWMFTALQSAAGQGYSPLSTLIAIGYCVFFMGSAALTWLWDGIGGAVLVSLGIIIAIGYPIWMSGRIPLKFIIYFELTMVVPALIAGFMLLSVWKKSSSPG